MKKCLFICIAAILLFSLSSRAEAQSNSESAPTGQLFFTVSRIDLSVVGESEDIYCGTAPLALVHWESDDENVVTFDNGIITAVGVGATVVRASFAEETLECSVSCLANDIQELKTLGEKILRSPKRYPPEVGEAYSAFFQSSAIIGDSISYILFQYETRHGLLGHPLFFVRGGVSLFSFVNHSTNIFYQGREVWLEEAVGSANLEKIFIMMGQNDLGYRTVEDTLESLDTLLSRFLEKNPKLEIYLQSCVAEWQKTDSSGARNEKIRQYNEKMKTYAQEHGYHFIDIAPYVEDHIGSMASIYSMDHSIHLNEDGCIVWMKALNAYACQQAIKEETK